MYAHTYICTSVHEIHYVYVIAFQQEKERTCIHPVPILHIAESCIVFISHWRPIGSLRSQVSGGNN